MRKRFLLLALVLVTIIGLLSAATYVQYSSHITLHGEGAASHMSGVVALASGGVTPPTSSSGVPSSSATAPQSVLVGKLTLHGSPSATRNGGVAPAVGGSGWTCEIDQYAVKATTTAMRGYATYICDGATQIHFNQYADYCAPLLWGCTWQNKYTFPSCTYSFVTSWNEGTCPASGLYDYVYNIPGGQLWRERSYVCGYAPGNTSDCGTIAYQVQF